MIQNDKAFYPSAAQAQEPGSNRLSFSGEGSVTIELDRLLNECL